MAVARGTACDQSPAYYTSESYAGLLQSIERRRSSGRATSTPRATRSTRGCAKSSPGISIRRPALRSGSTTRRSSAGIRGARSAAFADLQRLRRVRGRVAARRSGAALGAEGARRQAGLRVRDRRHDRHPEDARRVRRLPHRLRAVQRRRCPTSTSRKGSNWLMLGPVRPAPAAAGGRAPRAVSAAASASASISIRAGSSS